MPAARPPTRRTDAAPVGYTLTLDRLRHRYVVQMKLTPAADMQRVSLPVWIPGSYLVREFARHLSGLRAQQGRAECEVIQLDKSTWDIACRPGRPLTIEYTAYARDNSVRAAWLDSHRGFFNGTSVLLRAHGHEGAPHEVTVRPPADAPDWQLATAMPAVRADPRGFGTYRAADYDEAVDHPFELGSFWSGQFKAGGVPHRLVVAGAPAAFDGERLLRDARKICDTAIAFWHGKARPPHRQYVFMLNVVDDGYGGLEHRASTALICGRRDLPRHGAPAEAARVGEGYVTLLGLISHEYFHTWNVKRMRPAEFARYDYTQENYTRLLWFFEGFTSYYDDLLLRRAGLIDDAGYLKLLTTTANQVLQAPGRQAQSVAQASFDAWTRYYRPDENTPNSTISYYSKGALVALCLDLTLREAGRGTLDDVMRSLWQRTRGGPLTEADVAAVLTEQAGRSFATELAAWVHGTEDLPLKDLLEAQGVQVLQEPSQVAQTLGLRVNESGGTVTLKVVLDGGAAAAAGMAAGDEWLGVEPVAEARQGRRAAAASTRQAAQAAGWRLTRLEDLPLYAGPARRVLALVARDKRLLRLPLDLPTGATTWRLVRPAGADTQGWPAR